MLRNLLNMVLLTLICKSPPRNRPSDPGFTCESRLRIISFLAVSVSRGVVSPYLFKKQFLFIVCMIRRNVTSWWETDQPPALSPNIVTWQNWLWADLFSSPNLVGVQIVQTCEGSKYFKPVRGPHQRIEYFPSPILGLTSGLSNPVIIFLDLNNRDMI